MGLFEKAGFDVTAFPVAFRTLGEGRDLLWETHAPRNLETFEIAAKEWIGLVVYWATGRIDNLFPGPGARGRRSRIVLEGGRGAERIESHYSEEGGPSDRRRENPSDRRSCPCDR